jgi:hypothetical protein
MIMSIIIVNNNVLPAVCWFTRKPGLTPKSVLWTRSRWSGKGRGIAACLVARGLGDLKDQGWPVDWLEMRAPNRQVQDLYRCSKFRVIRESHVYLILPWVKRDSRRGTVAKTKKPQNGGLTAVLRPGINREPTFWALSDRRKSISFEYILAVRPHRFPYRTRFRGNRPTPNRRL